MAPARVDRENTACHASVVIISHKNVALIKHIDNERTIHVLTAALLRCCSSSALMLLPAPGPPSCSACIRNIHVCKAPQQVQTWLRISATIGALMQLILHFAKTAHLRLKSREAPFSGRLARERCRLSRRPLVEY